MFFKRIFITCSLIGMSLSCVPSGKKEGQTEGSKQNSLHSRTEEKIKREIELRNFARDHPERAKALDRRNWKEGNIDWKLWEILRQEDLMRLDDSGQRDNPTAIEVVVLIGGVPTRKLTFAPSGLPNACTACVAVETQENTTGASDKLISLTPRVDENGNPEGVTILQTLQGEQAAYGFGVLAVSPGVKESSLAAFANALSSIL